MVRTMRTARKRVIRMEEPRPEEVMTNVVGQTEGVVVEEPHHDDVNSAPYPEVGESSRVQANAGYETLSMPTESEEDPSEDSESEDEAQVQKEVLRVPKVEPRSVERIPDEWHAMGYPSTVQSKFHPEMFPAQEMMPHWEFPYGAIHEPYFYPAFNPEVPPMTKDKLKQKIEQRVEGQRGKARPWRPTYCEAGPSRLPRKKKVPSSSKRESKLKKLLDRMKSRAVRAEERLAQAHGDVESLKEDLDSVKEKMGLMSSDEDSSSE